MESLPDPQGGNSAQTAANATATHQDTIGPQGRVNPTTATSTTQAPSQTPTRAAIKDLAAFEAGRAGKAVRSSNPRKQHAGSGPEGRPGMADPTYLGTPRSARFKNLFEGSTSPPSLLSVVKKLYDLIEESIRLPRKGAEKITSLGSETAADIKTLAASALDLAESLADIPTIRQNPFGEDDEDHRVERALAGARAFGCQVPDVLDAKLDTISKSISSLQMTLQANHRP